MTVQTAAGFVEGWGASVHQETRSVHLRLNWLAETIEAVETNLQNMTIDERSRVLNRGLRFLVAYYAQ